MRQLHETLFERHRGNPLLTTRQIGRMPSIPSSNAGATVLTDGTTFVCCAVFEDRRGLSHLWRGPARVNGLDGWEIDPQPTLSPDMDGHPEENLGH